MKSMVTQSRNGDCCSYKLHISDGGPSLFFTTIQCQSNEQKGKNEDPSGVIPLIVIFKRYIAQRGDHRILFECARSWRRDYLVKLNSILLNRPCTSDINSIDSDSNNIKRQLNGQWFIWKSFSVSHRTFSFPLFHSSMILFKQIGNLRKKKLRLASLANSTFT